AQMPGVGPTLRCVLICYSFSPAAVAVSLWVLCDASWGTLSTSRPPFVARGKPHRARGFSWRTAALGLAALLVAAGVAFGETLPPPTGTVILTITGRIANKTSADRAEFDRSALEALGVHQVRTSTAWTDGISVFEGPLLCDLLNKVGASGTTL